MISIVTISMNQGQFLRSAEDSLSSQQCADLECIVVDAGLTGGSREYLATLRHSRVRLVLEPCHGPADGLNKGVSTMNRGVVGYLNADDVYLAGGLPTVVDVFHQ